MAHFLLIHGSWHGGWCWERLSAILQARGHEVWAPTLAGLAERADEASPQTGLATHMEQTTNLIEAADQKDLVLVGHSYGGLVLAATAERVPDYIGHLVFLDAFVPEHGQSAFDLMPGAESGFVQMMRDSGSDFLVPPLSPEDMGVTEPADVEWVRTRLTPMPILTHREKVEAPQRRAFQIPATYIYCLQFELGAGFAAQARRHGWQVLEADTRHDVMVTHPDLLADLLEQIPLLGSGRR
ncbi:MAG: alpha/beta fold hydrolase [Dehalococcoidia bacterium]